MLRPLLASLLVSFSVEAAHLDTVCKSAIDLPPKFTDGFVSRINHEGRSVIETMEGKEVYGSYERIYSILSQGEKLWALTYYQILELNKDGSLIKAHSLSMNKTMTLAGETLVVLGQGGMLTAIDTKSGEKVWTTYTDEIEGGEALSVVFDGTHLQVIFARSYEKGFTGVGTFEMKNGALVKKLSYESRQYGVIAPDAMARFHNGNLVINNGGWIHVIDAKQLAGKKALKPRWVSLRIPNEVNPHYMMLQGEFFFEGSALVGCGRYREQSNTGWDILSALFRVQM